jgi:hypothetical protein
MLARCRHTLHVIHCCILQVLRFAPLHPSSSVVMLLLLLLLH